MRPERLIGWSGIRTSMTLIELDVPAEREELGLDGMLLREGGKKLRLFPALLIGMLGVAESYLQRGLGAHMVKYAIGQAHTLSQSAGCRFVTVDSDPTPAALGLYEKTQFRRGQRKGKDRESTVWMYYDLGPL